ncbi:MAG: AcrB/AcrD/AcrF family protein, partial [Methyloprofundus sp.]|nr:AcrB/AcrD/AcrF family protein [Methyloprofundus sp.]
MDSLVRFSLKQKIFFNLVFVLLFVAGFYSVSELPTERYPNVNFGEVIIDIAYPGASPVDVETLVTRKLEKTLDTVENIEWLKATSYPERAHISLKFIDDSDYAFLYNEVRLKTLNIVNELPIETDPPVINNFTVNDFYPVVIVNLIGDHSNRTLALMAQEVKSQLQKIAGVKEVQIAGEFIREFHINLDPEKLRKNGVSYNEVVQALQEANLSIPAGSINTPTGNYLIKVDEKFNNRTQVIKTIIRKSGDLGLIRLENLISSAHLDYRDPVVISSVNGENAIAIKIIKTDSGKALDIKASVLATLDKLKPLLDHENLKVAFTQDSTDKIQDGISTLGLNMLVGMMLVSIIIWYFMGFRNAGIITIGIPFSFIITMLFMYITGSSLNEMTLFSFVLVTGIIVDDAIVVTENIYRHIQEGRNIEQAVVVGTSEVALPVISSTLTTIAAFLPMLLMSGPTGEFFAQIPVAVSFALGASLIECLIILPIHFYDFGPRNNQALSTQLEEDDFLLAFIRTLTANVLTFTLKYRKTSLGLVFLLFLSSIA